MLIPRLRSDTYCIKARSTCRHRCGKTESRADTDSSQPGSSSTSWAQLDTNHSRCCQVDCGSCVLEPRANCWKRLWHIRRFTVHQEPKHSCSGLTAQVDHNFHSAYNKETSVSTCPVDQQQDLLAVNTPHYHLQATAFRVTQLQYTGQPDTPQQRTCRHPRSWSLFASLLPAPRAVMHMSGPRGGVASTRH